MRCVEQVAMLSLCSQAVMLVPSASLGLEAKVHLLACVESASKLSSNVKTASRLVPLGRSIQTLSATQLQLPASSRASSCHPGGERLQGEDDYYIRPCTTRASARPLLQANTQRAMRCVCSMFVGLTGQYACPSGRTLRQQLSERRRERM